MKLYTRFHIVIIAFALFVPAVLAAQDSTELAAIKGVVLDADKKPVPGVSIEFPESGKMASNDAAGRFNIRLGIQETVSFRKPGYRTAKLTLNELIGGEVMLQKSMIDAEEADRVFIPFGTRNRREVTGSISTISGNELPRLPVSSLSNALAGRLPGLYVQQQTTQPGGDNASFLIRGQSTFSGAGQNPLVLVDGAVRDFSNMDVQEIESISVLKDASSLAWHGLRGGNGIVLVTTRRGINAKTRITMDVSGGIQQPENFNRNVDAYTFATLYNEASVNSGLPLKYDQAALTAYQTGSDPFKYPDNDLTGRFISDRSYTQRYVATVSGGNAFARYFTTASFYSQSGLLNESDAANFSTNINFKRYSIRTNIDLQITKQLDVSLDLGIRSENRYTPEDGFATVLSTIFTTPSNAYPLLNPDGSYGGTSAFQNNPLGMLQGRGFANNNARVMFTTLTANYSLDKLVKGLSAQGFFANNITQTFTSGRTQNYEIYEPKTVGYTRYRTKARLLFSAATFGNYDSRIEFWSGLSYKRTYGRHTVNADTRYHQTSRNRPGVLDDKLQGISSRFLYSYHDRYYVEGVATYQGSQNFQKSNRFFWYPAISGGWVVSEENFLKGIRPLNYFKLRASYGLSGNIGVIDRQFAYNDLWNRSTGGGPGFGTGFSAGPTATELPLGNVQLAGEKIAKTDLGFDAKFFDQSLNITADYFYEKRSGILTGAIFPSVLGQSIISVNEGTVEYKGFEAAASYTKMIGAVEFSLLGNVTFAKSNILELNESGIPVYQSQIGAPVTNKRLLIAEGIFKDQPEISSSANQQFSRTIAAGDIRYRDINKDGFINGLDAITTNKTDLPTKYYGFGFNLSWAGFDASSFFQGVAGRTIDINGIVNNGNNNNGFINQFSAGRWSPALAASALYPRLIFNDRGNNTQSSTYWLRPGDYLRLKNVELGYSLPGLMIKKAKLSGCRLYVSAFNLLTFKKMKEDIDPEIPAAGFGSAYPYLKAYSLGINLKF